MGEGLLLVGLVAMALLVAVVGVREHRAIKAARRSALDRCCEILDGARLSHGEDGFPRLDGRYQGRAVLVRLVPDTMTIRRLPQLWLEVTLLASRPGLPGFAALVRPSGNDYYSLTERFSLLLVPPAPFPDEVLVKGSDARAIGLLGALAAAVGEALRDARVKEFAMTERGSRLLRQVAEGKRGEHLLLRQADFAGAAVDPQDLGVLLDQLTAIDQAIDGEREEKAA